MGALVDEAADMALAWQAESGGSWSWEFGEREDGFYLAVLGPTEMRDQWKTELREGESFTTIPASLAVTRGGFERAVGVLTRHRRALFDGSAADERRPVVYNDYMNTLMGDPTTEKLLPLIESASAVGAEYFCIDAGWYDETGSDWWATVGDWVPSTTRFPGGIGAVFDAIRGRGMVPGLWLEPEAAGIRSDVARQLPDEAFFQRAGGRAVEQSRHMLDFSHPAVTERMDRVVDGLIGTYGLGYLKLDQNINMSWISGEGPGPGQAILNHARAYRAWLAALSARHPTVILENCASGGLRMDYSLLSVAHIQSMSDQQDYARLAAIAASAPTAVLPEQAAIWAYAQPDHSLDEIGFIMTSALLGRMHLSGRLNEMSASQLQQVSSAVATHKQLRDQLSTALSFWPLGVPRWEDDWLSLGMQSDGRRYLAIWRRSGITSECELPLPGAVSVRLAYPATETTSATWRLGGERLLVSLPSAPSSVLLEVLGERDGRDLEGASYV
jgi:alpha-galactosidase